MIFRYPLKGSALCLYQYNLGIEGAPGTEFLSPVILLFTSGVGLTRTYPKTYVKQRFRC